MGVSFEEANELFISGIDNLEILDDAFRSRGLLHCSRADSTRADPDPLDGEARGNHPHHQCSLATKNEQRLYESYLRGSND
jgi:hypothetical protein